MYLNKIWIEGNAPLSGEIYNLPHSDGIPKRGNVNFSKDRLTRRPSKTSLGMEDIDVHNFLASLFWGDGSIGHSHSLLVRKGQLKDNNLRRIDGWLIPIWRFPILADGTDANIHDGRLKRITRSWYLFRTQSSKKKLHDHQTQVTQHPVSWPLLILISMGLSLRLWFKWINLHQMEGGFYWLTKH